MITALRATLRGNPRDAMIRVPARRRACRPELPMLLDPRRRPSRASRSGPASRRPNLVAACVVALASSACVTGSPPLAAEPAARAAPSAEVAKLHALFDAQWERALRDNPLAATYLGDPRYDDRWPDLTRANLDRIAAADRQVLVDLAAIPRDRLPPAEQLNYDLFRKEYENRVAVQRYHPEYYTISPSQGGPQTLNELPEQIDFSTVAAYEAWLKRLETLPVHLEQVTALLRDGVAQKRTQPRVLMERVVPQLQMQLVATPEQSPFYARFRQYPDTIPAADRERLTARARDVIGTRVLPAYRKFDAFFRTEYLPKTRETVGIWDTPDGAGYYANRAAYFTTTDLAPDRIHAIGLQEVARIQAEMQKVMHEVGFRGARQEFFAKLRTDPQFYFTKPDELFRAYVVAAKQIEPELPKLFGRLYRTPFGVRAVPATSAPNTTTAYYQGPSMDGTRAGYYYVNLYKPEVRPKYEIEVLTVHESVPGHHLQIALAQEQGELPKFRRYGGYTAYIEGWALYSERLGYDLGLYQDPYSRFGQLTYDMWRAVRLVVDTGLHAKQWTRQQAIDYFKDNAAKTEQDIVNEIDRYIGWPGQALAYKIGQLKILDLRAKAQRELGPKFDIRAFHDTVLESGAVPLDVLERNVEAWIAARR
jgi:uncharacterized protein (DUF885 family)